MSTRNNPKKYTFLLLLSFISGFFFGAYVYHGIYVKTYLKIKNNTDGVANFVKDETSIVLNSANYLFIIVQKYIVKCYNNIHNFFLWISKIYRDKIRFIKKKMFSCLFKYKDKINNLRKDIRQTVWINDGVDYESKENSESNGEL